jgi:hypothetical protein
MDNSYPEYDSSCEYGTLSNRIFDNIPDRYCCIDVGFGFLVPAEFPNAYDGRFFIMVYTFGKDYSVNEYMISLDEPKYIYGSDKLPDDIKGIVINSIITNYRDGIRSINEECAKEFIDPNIPIPDYNLL